MKPAAWWLVFACAVAVALGLLSGDPRSARAESPSPTAAVGSTPGGAAPTPAPVHGLAPLPGGAPVPRYDLPPGTVTGDRGPSPAVFPPQKLTLRFDHAKHVKTLHLPCIGCHARAKTSRASGESLLPPAVLCDACHGTDHGDLDSVSRRDALISQCGYCHVGYRPGDGNRVERLRIPRPNLRFDHALHAARNIGCPQCHGAVQNLELATRDQLPRMRGCFRCHQLPPPAQGKARGSCVTCHLRGVGGVLRTRFPSGILSPPAWLHDVGHGPGWIERHRQVAANDSKLCSSCHTERYCIRCHDGRVRPRSVHPNDWLNLHAVAARQNNPRCTSCHREQSFCLRCHQRAGVTLSGPYANFAGRGRFHPPRSIWTDPPRGPGHHSWEAERNLNACVSCHTERDCATCHATAGVGGRGVGPGGGSGQGVDPHPPGFLARCRGALRHNARPCLVCHDPSDPKLEQCR